MTAVIAPRTARALDMGLTEDWLRWRWALFDEAPRRTCKRGHDWALYAQTNVVNGKAYERCGECRREHARASSAKKVAA